MNMADDDMKAIEKYAVARKPADDLRAAAITAHRRYLRDTKRYDWNIHMKFMSEVDSPCPDYTLRAMYRKQLLEQTAFPSAQRQGET